MNKPEFLRLPHHLQQAADVVDLIGYTPLARIRKVAQEIKPAVEVYGKAEWFNPGGSVKDRPAWNIVRTALESGELSSEKRLLDATSGNTGIAYAMIGAALGFGVTLCVPENVSPERLKILKAYGAELILTPAAEGSDGAIRAAQDLFFITPTLYFYADQYSNPANWKAHYETTAIEIWQQTEGRVTHFVAGLGTTGTFVGVSRRLKELNPNIRLISFQPDSPFHGLEGLKHLETAGVPSIYDSSLAHENRNVSTEQAYTMVKRLAREEGLMVGVSAGAAVVAALEVAQGLDEGVVVTILCDGAEKYLTEKFWEEA